MRLTLFFYYIYTDTNFDKLLLIQNEKVKVVILSLIINFSIVLWGFLMIGTLAIGGYFMFRKFLKQLPKNDGLSEMDWQRYYIEKTKHMWGDEEKQFLEELVQPVPELFRDVARQTIASKIGEVAVAYNAKKITQDIIIEGYIIGTPKRDHRFLRNTLKEKNIDIEPYEHLFELSKQDYQKDWKRRYSES